MYLSDARTSMLGPARFLTQKGIPFFLNLWYNHLGNNGRPPVDPLGRGTGWTKEELLWKNGSSPSAVSLEAADAA